MRILLFVACLIAIVYCQVSYREYLDSNMEAMRSGGSTPSNDGFSGGAPMCSNVSRVADVFYPTGNNTSCSATDGKLTNRTLWWGFPIGECMADVVCLNNCTIQRECLAKGLTLTGYNDCYRERDSCFGPLGWLVVSYANPNYFVMEFHSNRYCNDTTPDSRNITYNCGSFGWGMWACGYDTASYRYLDSCVGSNSVPEVSPASTLSWFVWFIFL